MHVWQHTPCDRLREACPCGMQAALRAALEGLQMSGGVELNVPAGRMATPLMRHQKLALAWMLQRERMAAIPRGGILADDQGLGKTVSTIALIVTNQPGDDVAEEAFATMDAQAQEASAANGSHDSTDAPRASTVSEHKSGDVNLSQSATSQSAATVTDMSGSAVAEARASEECNELVNADTNSLAHGAHETEQDGNAAGLSEGGTLIVCPTAVLNQWARELEAKVAKGAGTLLCVAASCCLTGIHHCLSSGQRQCQAVRHAAHSVLHTYAMFAPAIRSSRDAWV